MSLRLITVKTLVAAAFLVGPGALAQHEAGTTVTHTSAAKDSRFAIDLQPLPLILNAVPKGRGFGLGMEYALTDRIGVFGNVQGAALALNERDVKDLNKDHPHDLTISEFKVWGADAGARFYQTSAHSDSWYAGGRLSVENLKKRELYQDEAVTSRQLAVRPGIEGGYRWIYGNGMLVRLGAGLQVNAYRDTDVSSSKASAQETEGERLVQRKLNGGALAGMVDLGIGYKF